MFENFFNKKFKIRNKKIGEKVFIIAEAGSNHNGNLKTAFKLVDIAKNAGADAVKFQIFKAEYLVGNNKKLLNFWKKFEFQRSWIKKINNYCKRKNIIFLASPFDKNAVDMLLKAGVECFKIASSETLNLDFVNYISKKKRPLIISTGICNMADIYECLEIIKKNNNKNIALLQCTSIYPAKPKDLNLNVIKKYKEIFDFPIGFSDHSLGINASNIAVGVGAKIIEKHFTFDKKQTGPDHNYANNPQELKNLFIQIRETEMMLGSFDKHPLEEETKYCRKNGIYAKINMKKNTKLSISKIKIQRPQAGVAERYLNLVKNLRLKKNKKKNEPIKWSDLE